MGYFILTCIGLLGLGLLIAGGRMTVAGYRRIGTDLHCPSCDYNLTGSSMTLCPECGTQLVPAAVAVGQLQRRPVMICAGLVLFAVGVVTLLMAMVVFVHYVNLGRFRM